MVKSSKTAARTRQVSATPSVASKRLWFAAADGFRVSERVGASVERSAKVRAAALFAGLSGPALDV